VKPIIVLAFAIFPLALESAAADEIRRATLPSSLLGTWAENSERCTSKDKSNVIIETSKYGDGSGSCSVRWVVETANPHGSNYAVHALCTSTADHAKSQIVNIIIRPQGDDRAFMGRSFTGLKSYQRCPE
jgi:hypothetical protein